MPSRSGACGSYRRLTLGGREEGQLPERLVVVGEVLGWPGEGAGEVAAEALVGRHRVDRPAGELAGLGAADAAAEEAEQPVDREPGAVQVDAALEVGVERNELGQVGIEEGAQVGLGEQILLV